MTDLEAENSFVCRLVCKRGNGESMSELFVKAKKLGVGVDCFSDATCKAVWLGLEELFSKPGFEKATMYSVMASANAVAQKSKDREMRDVEVSTAYLSEIGKGVNRADPLEGYVDALMEARYTRLANAAFAEFDENVKRGLAPREAVSSVIVSLQNVLNGAKNDSEIDIHEVGRGMLESWKDAYHHRQELGEKDYCPGLPLPWPKLTRSIRGFGKVMTVVAARPGVGKTSFAIALIRFWLEKGLKVVFDSLDMEATELLKRQVGEYSGVSTWKFQNGEVPKEHWDAEFGKAQGAVDEFGRRQDAGSYRILCEKDAGLLKSYVKILKDQGKIDVLVVDYIQQLKCRGGERMNRAQLVTETTQILHSIVNEYGIPVLALSQLNRTSEEDGGSEPQLHNIKDSGEIEQDAANVLILHPNKALKEKWKGGEPPVQFSMSRERADVTGRTLMPMWLIVSKARDGETGKIPFVVNQARCTWYQGDYEAQGNDQFSRVWDLWKHDAIEEAWRKNGALIVSADEAKKRAAIDEFNGRLQPAEKRPFGASAAVGGNSARGTGGSAQGAGNAGFETYDEIDIGKEVETGGTAYEDELPF